MSAQAAAAQRNTLYTKTKKRCTTRYSMCQRVCAFQHQQVSLFSLLPLLSLLQQLYSSIVMRVLLVKGYYCCTRNTYAYIHTRKYHSKYYSVKVKNLDYEYNRRPKTRSQRDAVCS